MKPDGTPDGSVKVNIIVNEAVPPDTIMVPAPNPNPCPLCGLRGCPDHPDGPVLVPVVTGIGR